MCGGEIEVSKYMLVDAVRAGARPFSTWYIKTEQNGNESKNGDFNVDSQCLMKILMIR